MKSNAINDKVMLLDDFGIEITNEVITLLESAENEMQLDNITKALIKKRLNRGNWLLSKDRGGWL